MRVNVDGGAVRADSTPDFSPGNPRPAILNTCIRRQYNIPSGERYEVSRSVNTEMNALLQAGRAAAGCTMYLAGFERLTGAPSYDPPCLMCSKMLVNAGVGRVVVRTADGLRELDPQALYRQHLESVITEIPEK